MGYVYFAHFGRHIKIGFASNPKQRLEQIARPNDAAIHPLDFDYSAPGRLVWAIPNCRMRDERNMQLLFAHHWTGTGEWFFWSSAFEHQMNSIEFVTHAERLVHLRAARKALGITPGKPVKEERWGKQTHELLADALERRIAASRQIAA